MGLSSLCTRMLLWRCHALATVRTELHPNTVKFLTLTLVSFKLSLDILKLWLFLGRWLVTTLLLLLSWLVLVLLLCRWLVLTLLLRRWLVWTLLLHILNTEWWLILLISRLLLLLLHTKSRILRHILSLVHHFLLRNVLLGEVMRLLILVCEISEISGWWVGLVVWLWVVLLVLGQCTLLLLISNIIAKWVLVALKVVLLLLRIKLLELWLLHHSLSVIVRSSFLLVVNARSLLAQINFIVVLLLSAMNGLKLINNISGHLNWGILLIKLLRSSFHLKACKRRILIIQLRLFNKLLLLRRLLAVHHVHHCVRVLERHWFFKLVALRRTARELVTLSSWVHCVWRWMIVWGHVVTVHVVGHVVGRVVGGERLWLLASFQVVVGSCWYRWGRFGTFRLDTGLGRIDCQGGGRCLVGWLFLVFLKRLFHFFHFRSQV